MLKKHPSKNLGKPKRILRYTRFVSKCRCGQTDHINADVKTCVKQKYLLYRTVRVGGYFQCPFYPRFPKKCKRFFKPLPMKWRRTGCVKRNRKLTGSALAQSSLRVVRTSRQLSANRNRCPARYTSQPASPGATPDPRNG